MRNSKVLNILSTFTKREMSELGDFIFTPYFNSYEYVRRFWLYVRKFHPTFDQPELKKETVHRELYPMKKYSDDTLRHLLSQLKKVVESYLIVKNVLGNKFETNYILMNEYHQRKLGMIQESKMKELEEYFDKKENMSHIYFDEKMKYEIARGDMILESGMQYNIPDEFAKRSEYISYAILLNLVKLGFDEKYIREELKGVSISPVVKELVSEINIEKIISALEKNYTENQSPFSKILEIKYYELSCILNKEDDEIYRKFYSLMKENLNLFDHQEKYNLFTSLLNAVYIKISIGKTEFQKELIEIYKWMLELKLYSIEEGRSFNPVLFRNIFINSLKQGELDWAENFLDDYGKYLDEKNKDDLLKHYARLYFHRKEYEKSLEFADKIKQDSVLDKIDVNNIMLMCYYETGNLDGCYTVIDKYKHYLLKARLSPESFSDIYANFIKIFAKLIKQRDKPSDNNMLLLEKEIEQCNVYAFKNWIHEKISELTVLR